MPYSGDIWVLNKFAELAHRCGVRPSVANVSLDLKLREPSDDHYYSVCLIVGNTKDEKEWKAAEKMQELLGFERETFQEYSSLDDIEEVVDRALALAPRARSR